MGDTPDDELFKAIKEGGLAVNKSVLMPAWGGVLTDSQITEMVKYLRACLPLRQNQLTRPRTRRMTMNGVLVNRARFGSLAAVVAGAQVSPPASGGGSARPGKDRQGRIDGQGSRYADRQRRPHQAAAGPINGQIPGPLLRATEGDTIDFTLKNEPNNKNSHSVDFHAARTDVLTSFAPIKPGETKSYSFTADNPGIFFYHCGSDPMIQHIALGMFGAVIIDPKDPNAMPKADREYVLVSIEMFDNPEDVKS